MIALSSKEKLLCCALADDPFWQAVELRQWWADTGEEQAWEFSGNNDARPIMATALAATPGLWLPERWRDEMARTQARLRLFMEQLDRVAAAFAGENIRLVALKNSGIARGIYPQLAACPMGDIDVLVDPRDFRRAHACLLGLGYRLNSRSPLGEKDLAEAEAAGGSEYEFTLSDGSILWFELQWRPVAGRWIRHEQEPPAGELLARSVPIVGSAARLLAPEDNLLQVCLHTTKHSYVRAPGFRLHTDVDRIVRRCPVDWTRFLAEVERLEVRTAVYFALWLPTELLRTPVPAEALARLRPAAWKTRAITRSLLSAGLFNGEEHKWSKAGYIAFNLLLYDTLGGIGRAVFPDAATMRRRYPIRSKLTLPWWHARRLLELLMKRAKT